MNDATGRRLKAGQKIVYSAPSKTRHGTELKLAIVNKVVGEKCKVTVIGKHRTDRLVTLAHPERIMIMPSFWSDSRDAAGGV